MEAFKSAYNVALEENLVNKIRRVENAHDRGKNKESWSVINEIKGRNIFDIMAGVLQGDTLATYLFIIVVDYCMKLTLENHPDIGFTLKPARSKRHKAIKLADIEFADDIALLANSAIDAQTLLQTVEEIAASVGLKMNESKTKYMTEGNIEGNITSLNGENIEKVEDFVYLGSKIRASESDIDARKAKAWAACHKLKQIWKSDLRKAIKVRLFTALIESVLLYGSETINIKSYCGLYV